VAGLLRVSRHSVDAHHLDVNCIFVLLCCIFYVALLLPSPFLFDRYVIPLIPLFAIGTFAPTESLLNGRWSYLRTLAFAMVMAFGIFAIAGTRDYLMWNRLRWEALRDLMTTQHVTAQDIDGGFEFNGFYLFDPEYKGEDDDAVKSGWWVDRDTYQIALGPVPGYVVYKAYDYFHWMPPHKQKVFILKKIVESP
jgi:hypothetical protein